MTALRFQTGGGYQTLIYGLLSGDGGGCSRPSSLKKPASGASLDALIIKLFLWTSSYKLHTFISAIWYWWSLLYIAILRSRADSLRSHVVLREWLAFYSVFLNIHRSGVLTALAWLVPHETAAVSAQLLCTPYSHAPCHYKSRGMSMKLTTRTITRCFRHNCQYSLRFTGRVDTSPEPSQRVSAGRTPKSLRGVRHHHRQNPNRAGHLTRTKNSVTKVFGNVSSKSTTATRKQRIQIWT